MRFKIYYGSEPVITNADRRSFDRGNYECMMLMKDRNGLPVIVSKCKNPHFPVWKVESSFSCLVFASRHEAMEYCNRRFERA